MKDYKKILEGVVNIINTTEKSDIGFANICTYIGENCPELKESEDERIRKDLIVFVKGSISDKGSEQRKAYISWLEKHREPVEINPTEFDTRLQSLIGKFDSLPKEELIGSLSFWLNVVRNDGTYKEEKQGEQKPAEWSKEDEIRLKHILRLLDVKDDEKYLFMFGLNSLQDLGKDIAWLKSLKDKLQPQQKQEWSEEDVNFIEATIGLLNLVTPIDAASWGKSRLDCVDWLKSIKDKVGREVNCTTTKEWSEDDEQLYNDLSDTYYYNDEDYPEETYKLMLKRVLDWMTKRAKSLRPQWKPSDEQMEALWNVYQGGKEQAELAILYNDLKKLKG